MSIDHTESDQHFELHLPVTEDDVTITDLIAAATPLSKQQVKQCLHNGAVWLEDGTGIHRIRRAKKTLEQEMVVHVYYDRSIQQQACAPAQRVADHGDYSVWNKPCGMFSQGSRWGDHCTIYRYAEAHLEPQRPAFLVHRLDRAASGLILLAHNKRMANTLSRMFEQREIEKQYRVTVVGHIDEASLPMVLDEDIEGKPARSEIIAIEHHDERSGAESTRLIMRIISGRKHQIRRHLSGIGHPVVGDRLYGGVPENAEPDLQIPDLQLQCCLLRFTCPAENVEREFILASV